MAEKPVAEDLFSSGPGGARLVAGRRRSDGKVLFPLPDGESKDVEQILLGNKGTLWTFTVQRFRPKPPFNGDGDESDFEPYAVGYVELPGEAIVEARIVANDISQLCIGMPMQLVTETYRVDGNGDSITTYAFQPINEGAST